MAVFSLFHHHHLWHIVRRFGFGFSYLRTIDIPIWRVVFVDLALRACACKRCFAARNFRYSYLIFASRSTLKEKSIQPSSFASHLAIGVVWEVRNVAEPLTSVLSSSTIESFGVRHPIALPASASPPLYVLSTPPFPFYIALLKPSSRPYQSRYRH